jgi:hypothetical protein
MKTTIEAYRMMSTLGRRAFLHLQSVRPSPSDEHLLPKSAFTAVHSAIRSAARHRKNFVAIQVKPFAWQDACGAGANGVVLSREYTEMWLANLTTAGDTLRQEFAKSAT